MNIGSKIATGNLILFDLIKFFLFHRVDDDLRVDSSERHDYPRKISWFWKKVKSIKIDTAFQKDGITYFFSGKTFYKFNDAEKRLELEKPQVSSQVWMDCQYTQEEISSIQKSARIQNEEYLETSSAESTTVSVFTILLPCLSFLVLKKNF